MRAEVVNEVSALGGIRTRVGPLRRRVRIHYATRAWRREPESNRRHGVCSPVPSQLIASAERAPGLEPRRIGWRPIMLPSNITRESQRRAVRASGESRTRMVLATSEALVRTSIAGVGGTTGTRPRTFWVHQISARWTTAPVHGLVRMSGVEPEFRDYRSRVLPLDDARV